MLITAISLIWAAVATAGSVRFFRRWRKSEERFKHVTLNDELTGLLNRHGFWEQAKRFVEVVASAKRGLKRTSFVVRDFSLILLDIDHFKGINDRYGHACGDEVLRLVAHIIADTVRDVDLICRWGGEEFIIALVGGDTTKAVEKAERVRTRVADSFVSWRGNQIRLTLSCGVASVNGSKTLEEVLERTDKALYRAKEGGRNQVVVYEQCSTEPGT